MPHTSRALKASGCNCRASPFPVAINLRRMITGIAFCMALQSALPMIEAQEYELVPPVENGSTQQTGRGVTVPARVDVLFFPPGGSEPILVQRAFETSAATNQSTQHVFDVLNNAALDGVTQALAGGALNGRISVTAMCYAYGVDDSDAQSLLPMGLFLNPTDLNVTLDGKAALHSNIQVIPPSGR